MKSSELIRILKKDGWFAVRQKGSHMIMKHNLKSGQIVVPKHGSSDLEKDWKTKFSKMQESTNKMTR